MAANDDAKELKSIVDSLNIKVKEVNDSLKSTASLVGESINPFKEILNISDQLNAHKTKENQLTSDQLKKLSEKIQKERQNLQDSETALASRLTKLKEIQLQQEKSLKFNKLDKKERKAIQEALKGTLAEIKNNERAQEDLNEQINTTNKEVENLEKGLNKAAIQAKRLETLGKLKGSLDKISTPLDDMLSPMALLNKGIGMAINGAIQYDKRLGDTAKSMNLTYGEADRSNKAMAAFAKSSKSAYDNSEDLNKTVVELNKNLGTSIKFEQLTGALKEDVALMSQLENIAGLTAEESQGILQYTLATNQSATKATKELMANYKVAGLKRGVVLNEKDALKEVSKLSNAIKLSTAGGAAGLAKSVAAAKALGSDLSKVDDIAGSILNFEESIESELSAELLTGKQLNLEKARQAALDNNLAVLSDEIKKNVGGAAEFAGMNRIQQEAIAKSVGMSREELATTLTNQEALKNISASSIEDAQEQYNLAVKNGQEKEFLAKLEDESLAKQLKQTNMQDVAAQKQKEANDLLIMALGPMEEHQKSFKKILDTIIYIIDKTNAFKGLLLAIGAIMAAKVVMSLGTGVVMMTAQVLAAKAYNKELDKQGGKQASILAKEAAITASKVAGASASTLGAGAIPILAGIAAVMSVIGGLMMMNDGVIGPSGGSGYGSRVLYGPEGAISFNNKDTIVAGTNLFKADDMVSAPKGAVQVGGGGSSREIADLKGAIMALASRPVNVSIDGKKVIEATTGSEPNTQGVESAKNSFKMQ
jgi:hypothetical protein